MPAPNTDLTDAAAPEARAIVEPLGLDAGALGDSDFSALSLQHSSDQFTTSDLDTLANFQAELELDNINADDGGLGVDYGGEDVIVSSEETVECVEIDGTVDHEEYLYQEEPEAILPEIEDSIGLSLDSDNIETMTIAPEDLGQTLVSQPISLASNLSQGQSIVLVSSPVALSTSTLGSQVTISGGQILNKISSGNVTQMQHFQQQSLITNKSTSGNVQIRPSIVGRPIMATGVTGNLQGIKPLQTALKRSADGSPITGRNVYAKVIISGNQTGQGQPIILSTSQTGETRTSGQPIKIISSTGQHVNTTTRAITLAQAQQMGLITSSSKLQQILPSSPAKHGSNIILNKIMGSPVKSHPTKITMMQASSLKSPMKILPAPLSSVGQLRTVSATVTTMASSTMKSGLTPQKVIIRQGPMKQGTVLQSNLGGGQVIRIPASHNLLGGGGNVAQIQMPGTRQVQYVRLVSAAGSNTSTVMTATRPRMVPVSTLTGGNRPVTVSNLRPSLGHTVKMVPIAPATSNVRLAPPKTIQLQSQSNQRILIPSAPAQLRTVTTSTGQTILPSGTRNITYMLPAQYVQQVRNQIQSPGLPSSILASTPTSTGSIQASGSLLTPSSESAVPHVRVGTPAAARLSIEANGLRPRKPCNCTKSQCLKLYCDCFANGEFCYMCNCNNCFNNLQHEEDRQTAIKSCLERNIGAFRPKIGKAQVGDERRHNKGCNCKRSGCLKNYCECYEAKISCSNNCKCVGCRNVEEPSERNSLRDLADAAESRVQQMTIKKEPSSPGIEKPRLIFGLPGVKPQFNFVTSAVVSATVECLAAIAEEAEANNLSEADSERLMLEEFGRCLKEVINISDKADDADKAASASQTAVQT